MRRRRKRSRNETKLDFSSVMRNVEATSESDPPKIQKIFSMQTLFFIIIFLLSLNLLVIGGLGIGFFMDSAFSAAEFRRVHNFEQTTEKIGDLMKFPKILSDTVQSSLVGGLLNFSTVNYYDMRGFIYHSLSQNFRRTGLATLIVFFTNPEVDQFISMQFVNENGEITAELHERYKGYSNTTEDVIMICPLKTPNVCLKEDMVYFPWQKENSITHQSKSIYHPSFVSPYLFFCPGDRCDLYLAYTNPYWKNSIYQGTVGFAMKSTSISTILIERTLKNSVSFVFDIKTGFMISISSLSNKIYMEVNGTFVQAKAIEYSDLRINLVSNYIYNQHNNSLSSLIIGKRYSEQIGIHLVSYYRYNSDEADWVIVNFFNVLDYYKYFIIFSIIFVLSVITSILISCFVGVFGSFLFTSPLNNLSRAMNNVQYFDLSTIKEKKSIFYEVRVLQNRFYYLLEMLKLYKPFLPSHIIHSQSEVPVVKNVCSENFEYDSPTQSDNVSCSNCTPTRCKSYLSDKTPKSGSSNQSMFDRRSQAFFSRFRKFIKKREVTIIHIFVPDLLRLDSSELQEEHSKFLDLIQMNGKRGNIISFTESSCIFGFNVCGAPIKSHSLLAVRFALNISRESKLDVNIGVSSGVCNVSILGNESLKSQVVFGNAKENAKILYKHCEYDHI